MTREITRSFATRLASVFWGGVRGSGCTENEEHKTTYSQTAQVMFSKLNLLEISMVTCEDISSDLRHIELTNTYINTVLYLSTVYPPLLLKSGRKKNWIFGMYGFKAPFSFCGQLFSIKLQLRLQTDNYRYVNFSSKNNTSNFSNFRKTPKFLLSGPRGLNYRFPCQW